MTRSRSYTIAAILQFLLSAFAVVTALIYLPRGAAATDRAGDSPPYAVLLLATILGAVGMVAAYGVWRGQKWSVILTIVLRVVDGFSALPGLLSPNTGLQILALASVSLSALVIVLLLRRDQAGGPLTRDSSAP
jgi:hypothetical protein